MHLTCALMLPVLMSLSVSIAAAQEVATAAAELLIVRNTEDQRFWKSHLPEGKLKAPAYPKDLLRAGVSGCVAIGFYIEPDGRTTSYRVLYSIIGDSRSGKIGKNDKKKITSMFGNAVVKYLEGMKFVPGVDNSGRKRGFAYMPVSFSTDAIPLQRKCEIPDLEVFLTNKMAQTQFQ